MTRPLTFADWAKVAEVISNVLISVSRFRIRIKVILPKYKA